ncbi:hypothetical protein TEA_029197 [Camellia sinensis var. sinensis]|uniref:RWD domain-containing protein n=1 Tax=Camellia sinensis var. sinensis TaxID=542762 RepID=A0A4S4D534_CAMSN|nr:hypothetical protein TEA_029197 [Camellia sinensis var. sinensis]
MEGSVASLCPYMVLPLAVLLLYRMDQVYLMEQEMEIEALEAILMDEFKEIHSSESGLNTSNRCFQITICPQDDDADESTATPVCLALIFSHTENYPDEPPLLNVQSLKGIQGADLKILKEKLEQEASENLGMAMVYTLVSSAKEWLCEKFAQDAGMENNEDEETAKDDYYGLLPSRQQYRHNSMRFGMRICYAHGECHLGLNGISSCLVLSTLYFAVVVGNTSGCSVAGALMTRQWKPQSSKCFACVHARKGEATGCLCGC